MAKLEKALNFNFRSGKLVNILDILDDIELKFRDDLNEDIEVYTTYEEVQAETYNDEVNARTQILLLETLGYIDEIECDAMITKATEIRLAKLEEMEKKINNGKEN